MIAWVVLASFGLYACADSPPMKCAPAALVWDEEAVGKKIAKWTPEDLLAVQTIFRAAVDGEDLCGFSPEYLNAAPQIFRGEFESKKTFAPVYACGKKLEALTKAEAHACAKKNAARLCAKLR